MPRFNGLRYINLKLNNYQMCMLWFWTTWSMGVWHGDNDISKMWNCPPLSLAWSSELHVTCLTSNQVADLGHVNILDTVLVSCKSCKAMYGWNGVEEIDNWLVKGEIHKWWDFNLTSSLWKRILIDADTGFCYSV